MFIEASPHPVLTPGMQETFEQAGVPALTVPTLRRDHGDRAQLLHAMAQAFTAGVDVDWPRLFPTNPTPRTIDLPTYAFQHQHYWLEAGGVGDVRAAGLRRLEHRLAACGGELGEGGLLLTGRLSAAGRGWLSEHLVAGATLVPGAALVEWALRAVNESGGGTVEELALQEPLVLTASGGLQVQVVVNAADQDGCRDVRMFSRPDYDETWRRSDGPATRPACWPASGRPDEAGLAGAWPPPAPESVDDREFYQRAASPGTSTGRRSRGSGRLAARLRSAGRGGAPEAAGEHGGIRYPSGVAGRSTTPGAADRSVPTDSDRQANNAVRLDWGVPAGTDATTVRVRLSPHQQPGSGEPGLRSRCPTPPARPC